MDPLQLLANLLLSVTIGTLMVALVVYIAYKVREVRKPLTGRSVPAIGDGAPVFLTRYTPGGDSNGRKSEPMDS